MNGKLRAYDGVIDDISVSNGVIVQRARGANQLAETTPSQALPRQATLERILERATDVIGTREEAMRWLGGPVRALNYATPISLLADDAGSAQVFTVLDNLENGVL